MPAVPVVVPVGLDAADLICGRTAGLDDVLAVVLGLEAAARTGGGGGIPDDAAWYAAAAALAEDNPEGATPDLDMAPPTFVFVPVVVVTPAAGMGVFFTGAAAGAAAKLLKKSSDWLAILFEFVFLLLGLLCVVVLTLGDYR